MDFRTLIGCIIDIFFGAIAIAWAINDYHHERYFSFGANVMFAVVFATMMVKLIIAQ